MTKERVCANSPVMSRRTFVTALPASGAALGFSASGASARSPETPFLAPIAGEPDMLALCYPKTKIDHAYCYMLNDGSTIFAEFDRWRDDSIEGWCKIRPGQFDGRVIGRVISVHMKAGSDWVQGGSGWLVPRDPKPIA